MEDSPKRWKKPQTLAPRALYEVSTGLVAMRSGPGTSFESVGVLRGGHRFYAVPFVVEGKTWLKMDMEGSSAPIFSPKSHRQRLGSLTGITKHHIGSVPKLFYSHPASPINGKNQNSLGLSSCNKGLSPSSTSASNLHATVRSLTFGALTTAFCDKEDSHETVAGTKAAAAKDLDCRDEGTRGDTAAEQPEEEEEIWVRLEESCIAQLRLAREEVPPNRRGDLFPTPWKSILKGKPRVTDFRSGPPTPLEWEVVEMEQDFDRHHRTQSHASSVAFEYEATTPKSQRSSPSNRSHGGSSHRSHPSLYSHHSQSRSISGSNSNSNSLHDGMPHTSRSQTGGSSSHISSLREDVDLEELRNDEADVTNYNPKSHRASPSTSLPVVPSIPRARSTPTISFEGWSGAGGGGWVNCRQYGVHGGPTNDNCGRFRQLDDRGRPGKLLKEFGSDFQRSFAF